MVVLNSREASIHHKATRNIGRLLRERNPELYWELHMELMGRYEKLDAEQQVIFNAFTSKPEEGRRLERYMEAIRKAGGVA